ncbi:uncharacterized protein [Leptinotarsa decemlineata]|uniref:uncharacterized protein n=1 Tax=Leptinotarsa decemlineata TaxID=7539 RepID=UPI003D3098D0
MAVVRAKFCFASVALDTKTTILRVRTIQLEGEDTSYEFPEHLSTKENHPKLFETTIVKNIAKSLKTRGKFRKVWISLGNELKSQYLDEEGNVCYDGIYLDECRAYVDPSSVPTHNLEAFPHEKTTSRVKNMILDKFFGKNQNAVTFMDLFISECTRLNCKEENYAETLRFFLEGPALDWFQSFLKINKITRPWEYWKNSFIDTFAVIGWPEIKYAYEFRYLNGSLLEYALKKRNLLLDTDSKISENTQINLIVLGLPVKIQFHINRKDLNTIDNLMSLINQLEGLKEKETKIKTKIPQEIKSEKKPCPYCTKKGFPNRYHSEGICRLKLAENTKNERIKIINNTNIEESVSFSEESKNESRPHLSD